MIACEFDFLGAADEGEPGPAHGGMMERLLRQFDYDRLAALIESRVPATPPAADRRDGNE